MGLNKFQVARIRKGLTQRQLAEKLNVTQQTISNIECGNVDPSFKLMQSMCRVLGMVISIDQSGISLVGYINEE